MSRDWGDSLGGKYSASYTIIRTSVPSLESTQKSWAWLCTLVMRLRETETGESLGLHGQPPLRNQQVPDQYKSQAPKMQTKVDCVLRMTPEVGLWLP